MITAALLGAAVFLSFYVGVRAVRSTGALPVWRVRRAAAVSMRAVPSLADEAERARILATPVEELAEEIVRERERAAPGYLSSAQATYAQAIASFVANYGASREGQTSESERIAALQEAATFPRRSYRDPSRCLLDACSGPMFSSPTTKQSICGRCGRVVDWEAGP